MKKTSFIPTGVKVTTTLVRNPSKIYVEDFKREHIYTVARYTNQKTREVLEVIDLSEFDMEDECMWLEPVEATIARWEELQKRLKHSGYKKVIYDVSVIHSCSIDTERHMYEGYMDYNDGLYHFTDE